MRVNNVIRRGLLLAGYNIRSLNFDRDELYQTSTELLEMMTTDLIKHIGLASTIKMAKLPAVKTTNNFGYNEFLDDYPDAKLYRLPDDFIEYVGGTVDEGLDTMMLGSYIAVFNPNRNSIFSLTQDYFRMQYRAELSLDQMPNYMETYASIKLAQEMIMLKRPDDTARLQNLANKETEEVEFLRNNMGLRRVMHNGNTQYGGWR